MKVDIGWRAGYDGKQHFIPDAMSRKALCQSYVKDVRYDNPDLPKCERCLKIR